MSNNLLPRLARHNMKKNGRFYIPYVLAASVMIAIFYLLIYVATNNGLEKMQGVEYVTYMLQLGSGIVGFFALMFIFYINNFLMKHRSKEIGLYNVLGMEKKHIGRLLFIENMMTTLVSLGLGLGMGILFSKLIVLLFCKAMRVEEAPLTAAVSVHGVGITIVLFAGIFLAVLVKNQATIHLAHPIALLQGGNRGEREPKTRVLLFLIGMGCLVAGYVMAIGIDNPLKALTNFFIAVVLVMVGTYCLFTVGSIAILKMLKKNKRYYYRANHFTSVSGLLFRMRQNAFGMSNICILSTMVLVTLSTTVCFYIGIDDAIEISTPGTVNVSASLDNVDYKQMALTALDQQNTVMVDAAQAHHLKATKVKNYISLHADITEQDGVIHAWTPNSKSEGASLSLLTEEQYKRYTGKTLHLGGNEIIALADRLPKQVTIAGKHFDCVGYERHALPTVMTALKQVSIVVKDESVMKDIETQLRAEKGTPWMYYHGFFTIDAPREQINQVMATLAAKMPSEEYEVVAAYELQDLMYAFTGGFLFLGILLGTAFSLAAALIIYYKQLSEGYYDKKQYEIMQKVGMSKQEVKRSIRSQILLVFFAPLLVAGCHLLGASNMIYQMLRIFGLVNLSLFISCAVATFIVFAIIYGIIYALTARSYYHIVRWES